MVSMFLRLCPLVEKELTFESVDLQVHSESSSLLLYPGVSKSLSYVRIISGNHSGGKNESVGKNELQNRTKRCGEVGLFFLVLFCFSCFFCVAQYRRTHL